MRAMSCRFVFAALLAAAALSPAAAQESEGGHSVDVGVAKWDTMPRLRERTDSLDYSRYVGAVETMLKEQTCKLPGQSWKRFDITVPYAVLVEPDGRVERVLVSDMDCPSLETIVGMAAIERLNGKDFRLAGGDKARWHAAEMSFSLR